MLHITFFFYKVFQLVGEKSFFFYLFWKTNKKKYLIGLELLVRVILQTHVMVCIINRPGVAGAVLQTALALINSFMDLPFSSKSLPEILRQCSPTPMCNMSPGVHKVGVGGV